MERKNFLKSLPLIGLGGMLLAGCNTTSSADFGSEETDLEGDARFVQQAAERDAIVIQTYQRAAESGILETQTLIDTATVYMGHHVGHLDKLNSLLSEFGAELVALDDFQADEGVSFLETEAEFIELAMTLEFEAAQAYFSQMVNELEQLETRKLFGNIYPIKLAHFVTLKKALNRSPAVNTHFLRVEGRVGLAIRPLESSTYFPGLSGA